MFTPLLRLLCCGLVLTLSACGDPDQMSPRSESAGGNLAAAQRRAAKTVDAAGLNRALETFYVQEGRFPKSLGELVERGYLREVPVLPEGYFWEYDATNGLVTIDRKPPAP